MQSSSRQRIVELHNVTVDLPVYSVSARSLRRSVLNLPVGGRLLKNSSEQVSVRALDGVSIDLYEGDRLGLLGHNGSGKTTMLRTIAGIYAPSSGVVRVSGEVSSVLEIGTGLDAEASGEENVRLLARYRGISKEQAMAALPEIAEFTGLGVFMKMPLKTYSQGMLSRLIFAVATSFAPDILVMDEWIATGDEAFITKAEERLLRFVAAARVLIIATHNPAIIARLCNKAALMEHGRIVSMGPVNHVLHRAA
jgi:ABC-type polysaccharide/polyol phosphate transport system ATPase subunit